LSLHAAEQNFLHALVRAKGWSHSGHLRVSAIASLHQTPNFAGGVFVHVVVTVLVLSGNPWKYDVGSRR